MSKPSMPKRSFRHILRGRRNSLSTSTSTRRGIWSNAASTSSSTFGASPPATRRRRGTSSPSSPSQPSSCGSDDCQQDLAHPRAILEVGKGQGADMTETTAPAGERPLLDRYFRLAEHGTDVRTEVVAGVTTFLTMVYIVFVNPQILGNAGMDKGAVFVATCIASAVSTLVMGLYANYPIALAPGMGLNAFFAFTVVLSYKYTWQQALAAVFCSGVLFFLISVFRIREYIINSIPKNMKLA